MPDETRRDWEEVQRNATDITERLRVAGGWLYRTMGRHAQSVTAAMVFVPGHVQEYDEPAGDTNDE